MRVLIAEALVAASDVLSVHLPSARALDTMQSGNADILDLQLVTLG